MPSPAPYSLGEGDSALVAHLHQQSFPIGWTEPDIQTMLTTPGTHGWGIDADTLHALLIVRIGDDTADILTLAVAQAFRRQGLAQQLIAHAALQLKALRVARMVLEVAVVNAPAIALYQRCRFTEIGRRKDYYRQADGSRADAIVMERKL